jgi:hypothetical protein
MSFYSAINDYNGILSKIQVYQVRAGNVRLNIFDHWIVSSQVLGIDWSADRRWLTWMPTLGTLEIKGDEFEWDDVGLVLLTRTIRVSYHGNRSLWHADSDLFDLASSKWDICSFNDNYEDKYGWNIRIMYLTATTVNPHSATPIIYLTSWNIVTYTKADVDGVDMR